MDDSQEQTQTQPPAAAGAPSSETGSLGDRVREVREHLERASAALAALDQLLPAGNQLEDQAKDQAEDRSQQ